MFELNDEIRVSLNAIANAVKTLKEMTTKKPQKKIKISKSNSIEEVTDIDIEINRQIAEELAYDFPRDKIIGEELSIEPRQIDISNRFWLIDPIDGTRSLTDNINGYSIMIALISDNQPNLGIIFDVRYNDTFIAIRNAGVYKVTNQGFLNFSSFEYVRKNLIWNPYSSNPLRHNRLRKCLFRSLNFEDIIEVESCGLRALHLAKKEGALLLSLPNSAKTWDTAAGNLFISETGGIYTDLQGNKLRYSEEEQIHRNGALATIGIDHNYALSNVNKCILTTRSYE